MVTSHLTPIVKEIIFYAEEKERHQRCMQVSVAFPEQNKKKASREALRCHYRFSMGISFGFIKRKEDCY